MTKSFNELYESLWPFSKETKFNEIKVLLTIDDYGKEKVIPFHVPKPTSSKLSDEEFVKDYYKKKDNKYIQHFNDRTKVVKDIKDIKVVTKFPFEK